MDILELCTGELFKDDTSHIMLYSLDGSETRLDKEDELRPWDEFLLIFKKDGSKEILVKFDSITKIEIHNLIKTNDTISIF